ncbi:MAG TPA: mandelate racemase/muconate lactonizing enzyme family protein [Amycolatopsis sp.]|nr:mandelate racemase/muconate lactonizing enzyme family protein [Amycolatopsis sp.]
MHGIDGATLYQVAFPLARPMWNGTRQIRTMHTVLAVVHAGEHSGLGYAFALTEQESAVVHEVAILLVGRLLGADLDPLPALTRELRRSAGELRRGALAVMATACLDTALWDLWARWHGKSVCRLLGGRPISRSLYGSGGSLGLSLDELVEEAVSFQDRGYRGYKFKVGGEDLEADVDRVLAVRAQVGPEFMLAVDANQAWERERAALACVRLAPAGLAWIEEPLPASDVLGLARLRRGSAVPLAAGETLAGTEPLLNLMRAGAVDILQPDLMMCGGVTAQLEVAAAARDFGVRLVPHLFTEFNAQLMATAPADALVEHLEGWFEHLFLAGPDISSGAVTPSDAPGFGLEPDLETLGRYGTSLHV